MKKTHFIQRLLQIAVASLARLRLRSAQFSQDMLELAERRPAAMSRKFSTLSFFGSFIVVENWQCLSGKFKSRVANNTGKKSVFHLAAFFCDLNIAAPALLTAIAGPAPSKRPGYRAEPAVQSGVSLDAWR
jgi:hypothetical protein